MSHKAFFDENALLAGVVRREFSDPNSIAKYAEDFKNLDGDKYVQIFSLYMFKYHLSFDLAGFSGLKHNLLIWAWKRMLKTLHSSIQSAFHPR